MAGSFPMCRIFSRCTPRISARLEPSPACTSRVGVRVRVRVRVRIEVRARARAKLRARAKIWVRVRVRRLHELLHDLVYGHLAELFAEHREAHNCRRLCTLLAHAHLVRAWAWVWVRVRGRGRGRGRDRGRVRVRVRVSLPMPMRTIFTVVFTALDR